MLILLVAVSPFPYRNPGSCRVGSVKFVVSSSRLSAPTTVVRTGSRVVLCQQAGAVGAESDQRQLFPGREI